MKIKYLLLVIAILLTCYSRIVAQTTQDSVEKKPFTIGEQLTFHSKILGEKRLLNIYLPQNFHPDSAKQYNVIYLLDGSAEEDFIHVAGIVQFATYPWVNILPESIVVGISNVDRKRDFTYPTSIAEDKEYYPTTGSSEKFIDFLEKEVQPLIKATYPITANKMLIGQSLGGLLATEVLIKKTYLFDTYIIISPSLWWDNESLLKETPQFSALATTDEVNVIVMVGKEGQVMEDGAKKLVTHLKENNTQKNMNILFHFFEKQDHATILHLAVYQAFMMLKK